MPIDGTRFAIERQKLCLWLEGEKKKLEALPDEDRLRKEADLEREFRAKIDRLYGDVRHPDMKKHVLN
jgi:hypothetical protein